MDILNFFIIGILMIISAQYNYDFFSVLIVIIYSLFNPSIFNLSLVVLLLVVIFINTGKITLTWFYFSIILSAVIILISVFGKNKKKADAGEGGSGGYDDLLKMLGQQ